jgi:hypothetical protein
MIQQKILLLPAETCREPEGWRSDFPDLFQGHSGAAVPEFHRFAFQLGPRLRSGTPSTYSFTEVYNSPEKTVNFYPPGPVSA